MAVTRRLPRTTKKPVRITQFEINNLIERGNQWTRYREAMQIMGMEHPIICTKAMQMMAKLSTGARVPITARDTMRSPFYNWSLQTGRSAAHRKVGKVAEISPLGVPGLDQLRVLTKGSFRESEKLALSRSHKAVGLAAPKLTISATASSLEPIKSGARPKQSNP